MMAMMATQKLLDGANILEYLNIRIYNTFFQNGAVQTQLLIMIPSQTASVLAYSSQEAQCICYSETRFIKQSTLRNFYYEETIHE